MPSLRRILLSLPLVCAAAALAGCEKPLFPENQPRTPYDRYLSLHGQSRPMSEEDAFGAQQPNLRERLKPLDQQ